MGTSRNLHQTVYKKKLLLYWYVLGRSNNVLSTRTNKNRLGTGKVKYKTFSRAWMPSPIIPYLLETSWRTVHFFKKRFLLYWEVMGHRNEIGFFIWNYCFSSNRPPTPRCLQYFARRRLTDKVLAGTRLRWVERVILIWKLSAANRLGTNNWRLIVPEVEI